MKGVYRGSISKMYAIHISSSYVFIKLPDRYTSSGPYFLRLLMKGLQDSVAYELVGAW